MTNEELEEILRRLAEIASRNPKKAQELLQQNPPLLYALLEAEYQEGMITQAAPGMDILLKL